MYLAILLSLLSFASIASDKFTSGYSDLEDCKVLESSENDPNAEMDYFRSLCPGRDKIKVFIVGGDARSWLELEIKGKKVDLYEGLLSAGSSLGVFPYVSGKKLEWRYKGGSLHALIVRMGASDPETNHPKSGLVVLRVKGNSVKVIGLANTNEDARKIADSK